MAVKRYNGTSWDTVAGLGAQGAAATSSSITTWVKTATGGETSLTGSSDSSTTLAYTAGQEQLFINGVLQVRGSDYTATNGTSITGLTALVSGDIATVTTVNAFSVTGAVPLSTVTANGDLIVGTSSGAVGRLGVGSTSQVLTVSGGVPTWAAPAAGGMTVIATGTLSGAAVTLSSIPSTYNNLQLDWYGATWGTGNAQMTLRFNGLSSANYHYATNGFMGSTSQARGAAGATEWFLSENTNDTSRTNALNHYSATFYNYASTTGMPLASTNYSFFDVGNQMASFHGTLGYNNSAAAITSLTIAVDLGYTFSGGTYVLYGVK